MFNKKILVIYKILFALLGFSAVAREIITLIDRGTFNFINFFSYFTNQSNIFAGVTLLLSAYFISRGIKTKNFVFFRGAASLYMIITGVVFAVLLSGSDPALLTAVPIDNTILHYIMPVVLLLDWLIDPPVKRLRFKFALVWLAYPLIYVASSLIRGAINGFYPYPFLNPATGGGYLGILVTAFYIILFVIFAIWLMTRLPLKKKR